MTIRVLQVFKTYFPESVGGIEKAINSIAQAVVPYGVETTVFSLGKHRGFNQIDGHRSYTATRLMNLSSTGFSLDALPLFRELASQADIVHYQFPWPFMDMLHFCSGHGKPSVVSYQSDIVRQSLLKTIYAPLMRRFLATADRIVVTSPNLAASSGALQSVLPKVVVIPIGLDETLYPRVSPVSRSVADRLPERYLLFVGVLRYYKGLHILIEAAALARVPVVIAGDGPMGEELRTLAKRRSSADVTFIESVTENDKVALLASCDAFVFPSHLRSEAYGIALVEAAMMGKPMISCEIGTGTSYVNLDGETGLVVAPNDPQALAGAMRRIWNDRTKAIQWGRAARIRYEDKFTAQSMGADFAELYSGLLKGNRG